ncbi:MAG: FAD-dependent oxidoreductase [Candidatus Marinimicrobia bacterium]|nr:FAD-dependent oxidoreductase [Candidatus Neomarinimicrobiota bacterium]MCF7828743.1 FAD-dependent oxidoreductase [Candidatus Neomarinimicrobiota bacterium]MCF7880660.1 FAD-dependent oxidoreductase [Candidatus Neomarinimicrobiota bacterium]
MKTVILGSGIAGLSISYFLGHENCLIYEKKNYYGGHVHSYNKNGFVWDEGPHVSFTNNQFVKDFLKKSLGESRILEYPVETVNYYHGDWIPHPAQSNMYAIPEGLREECFNDFINTRDENHEIENYKDWLIAAFGPTFYEEFPRKYTEKYWTVAPEELTTDWIGKRVFYPDVETVKKGYKGDLDEQTHYIKHVRYPKNGGFVSFLDGIMKNSNIYYRKDATKIDLIEKRIIFSDDTSINYDRLISTIPLPDFVKLSDAPNDIESASKKLLYSSILLINIEVSHPAVRNENWIYVYDKGKYSTRIYCTEIMSRNNAPEGKCGIQVEVYCSKYDKFEKRYSEIARTVIDELIEMGLVISIDHVINFHTKFVRWGNVIFDHKRKSAQEAILNWLSNYGLVREEDDLEPLTIWENKFRANVKLGSIILAGRYAQWKYYWTDDCVLRGKYISESI